MVRGVSAAARERAQEQDSNAGLHAWLETNPNQRDSSSFVPYAAETPLTMPDS